MPKIEYKSIKFQQKSLELIRLVNQVVEEYQAQGYELTLRQAYYQLVARGYIPNNERSYKNIGNLINDGRLAGLIDWHSITDRTRNLRSNSHWDNPADVIASARYSYLLNKWDGQPNYVEVWVEKDALVDIVGQACRPLDTPYFSCRGYTSQSEMWSAAQRFISQDYRDNRVTGNRNTGNRNTGDCNTGDWNKSSFNTGCFNTEEQKITLFNKPSGMTYCEWMDSDARYLLNQIPKDVVEWVYEEDMTDEEKATHPTYETTGGYLKVLDESECGQLWWGSLSDRRKEIIKAIPNFDAEIFFQCTGVRVDE